MMRNKLSLSFIFCMLSLCFMPAIPSNGSGLQTDPHTLVPAESVTNPVLGYQHEDGSFVSLTQDQVLAFWKYLAILSPNAALESYTIQKGTDDAQNTYYYLSGQGRDGSKHFTISALLDTYGMETDKFILNGKLFMCTAESANHNCIPTISSTGSCSLNGQDAKHEKTSTAVTPNTIASFFAGTGK